MKHKYGWRPDKPDFRDHYFTVRAPGPLPDNVDLRPGMPPVYDQGQLGSCTGNAIAGAIEYQRKREGLPDFVPSRLFIYYNERSLEGTVPQDAGAEIRDGIKTVNQLGACPETMWSYDVSKFADKPRDDCYNEALADLVTSYARVDQTEQGIMGCIAAGFPMVFGFTVYDSFEGNLVAHTGLIPMPSSSEHAMGGHAVLACGYDRPRRLFQVRNSWGPGWGDQGYFWMPFDYLTNSDLACDLWQVSTVSRG